MPKTNTLDFSSPAGAEKALQKITQQLGRAGQSVVSSEFNQKPRRSSDTTYREAFITLASGQLITLRVNGTGDIYQVLLNGSVKPLKEHADTDKAIAEIASLAEKNQGAFQKAQARKAIELPKGMTTTKPKQVDALVQQVSELDAQISERKATIVDLQSKLGVGAMIDSVEPNLTMLPDGISWLGFKLVDQVFVDKTTASILPSAESIAGKVRLNITLADGSPFDVIGVVVAVKFSAPKIFYSVALPVRQDAESGQTIYAVLHDVDSIFVSGISGAMMDSADRPQAIETMDVYKEPLPTSDAGVMSLASSYVAARELTAALGVMLDAASTDGAKGYLKIALDTVENNGPINLAEGKIEQARLQLHMAKSFRAAIAMLDSASERQMDDKALDQLVAIAKTSAASEDEIADQDALTTLLALSMVDVAEGIYFLSEKGRQHLNDNGLDAYGEPFAE
jgi:hypothetical protein